MQNKKINIDLYINFLQSIENKYQHLYPTFTDHDHWVNFINDRMAD